MDHLTHLSKSLGSTSTGSASTAAQIDALLLQLQMVLENDPVLSAQISYSVKPKGHNDKARMAKLQRYPGPDLDTVELVEAYAGLWKEDPSIFWNGMHRFAHQQYHSEPQALIVSHYLNAIRDDS